MANEPIIFMKDDNDVNFYPLVHIEGIQGWPDNLSDLDVDSLKDEVSGVSSEMVGIQSQIKALQTAIASMPAVSDTGWQTITFLNNTIAYDTSSTPKARLFSVNGVYFLSLKGAFKGLTSNNVEIGRIPSSMIFAVKENKSFAQNMSVSNSLAQFTRMRVDTNGTIKVERATVDTITSTQWVSIDTTLML